MNKAKIKIKTAKPMSPPTRAHISSSPLSAPIIIPMYIKGYEIAAKVKNMIIVIGIFKLTRSIPPEISISNSKITNTNSIFLASIDFDLLFFDKSLMQFLYGPTLGVVSHPITF